MIKKVGILLLICAANIQYFLPNALFATIGYPIINNYSSSQLGSPLQVWGMVQDTHGVFYLAANSGVVKFDGSNWQLYETQFKSPVRSIAINDRGTIFVGATREFGYFKPNTSGKYEFNSLSDTIKNKNFGAVLKTFIIGSSVYFIADHKRIFLYENEVLKELSIGYTDIFRAFKIQDALYLFSKNKGIHKIQNGKIYSVDTKSTPGNVYFALSYEPDKLLIGTLMKGLFIYDLHHNKWIKFQNEVDEQLIEGNAYYATILKNKSIAISTLKQGVFIIDAQGKVLLKINKHIGLINNSTFFLYEDKYHDLWVGQEKGLSQIELSIPFSNLGIFSGIDGSLQKLTDYNKHLFCGSSSGIYIKPMPADGNKPFQTFKNIDPNYIYSLDYLKLKVPGCNEELLLASCLRNLVWITPDIELKELYDIYGCYAIAQSKKHPQRIFLGNPSGIEVLELEYSQGKLSVTKALSLPGIKESVRNILITSNGDLWMRTAFNNIFKIEFDEEESLTNFHVYSFEALNEKYPAISVSSLNNFGDKIVITSNYGVFSTYIKTDALIEKSFVPDNSFGTHFREDSLEIKAMAKDNNGNYWLASQKGLLMYNPISMEILHTPFKRLMENKIQYIKPIHNNGVCFLSEEELFFSDDIHSKTAVFDFDVSICQTDIGNSYKSIWSDALLSSSFDLKEVIPENENSITFTFCAPFYHKTSFIQYSSRLQGFDKNWSDYNPQQLRSYTNLPSGNYTFKVKARNIYGVVSNEANFSFTIATPWYGKTIAYISYFLLSVLLIWLFIVLYFNKLNHEKHELQRLINEAVSKVEQQKDQIRLQANKLQEANVELEKLSLVASKTDNAIVIMDPHGEIEWINEGYERMYGFSLHDLLLNGTNIIGDNASVPINDMVNVWFGKREPIIYKNLKKTKSGKSIWAQTTLTPILGDKNELIHLIAIDTDISLLKRAEFEIEAQRDEIEAQRDLAIRQRDEITFQKDEIIASIEYANRIQKAIFMDENDLHQVFPHSFSFNKPRDIVSGDFLWVHQLNHYKIIALVDCTGHGVPGAFMSLLGISFFNAVIKEQGLVITSEILNTLRDKVISSLGQTGKQDEANDGMDVSLMVINTQTGVLTFSGANNSACIVRNNEIIMLEADNMPISISHNISTSFTEKHFQYQANDRIYLYSDGYADQFGGSFGKKYKIRRFKDLLLRISHQQAPEQKKSLANEYENWKGRLDQVDDILVVGIIMNEI